jgi:hypothetical protein
MVANTGHRLMPTEKKMLVPWCDNSTAVRALWKSGGLAVQSNENFIRAVDEEPEIYALQTHFMTDFCITPHSTTEHQNHCSN